jgi:hypothetical protein
MKWWSSLLVATRARQAVAGSSHSPNPMRFVPWRSRWLAQPRRLRSRSGPAGRRDSRQRGPRGASREASEPLRNAACSWLEAVTGIWGKRRRRRRNLQAIGGEPNPLDRARSRPRDRSPVRRGAGLADKAAEVAPGSGRPAGGGLGRPGGRGRARPAALEEALRDSRAADVWHALGLAGSGR